MIHYVYTYTISSFSSMACTFTNSLALSSSTDLQRTSAGPLQSTQESNRWKLERRDLLERPILVKRFSFFFFSFNSRSTIYCKYSNTHPYWYKKTGWTLTKSSVLTQLSQSLKQSSYNHAGKLSQIELHTRLVVAKSKKKYYSTLRSSFSLLWSLWLLPQMPTHPRITQLRLIQLTARATIT